MVKLRRTPFDLHSPLSFKMTHLSMPFPLRGLGDGSGFSGELNKAALGRRLVIFCPCNQHTSVSTNKSGPTYHQGPNPLGWFRANLLNTHRVCVFGLQINQTPAVWQWFRQILPQSLIRVIVKIQRIAYHRGDFPRYRKIMRIVMQSKL